jgi:hypothetical protein
MEKATPRGIQIAGAVMIFEVVRQGFGEELLVRFSGGFGKRGGAYCRHSLSTN